MIKLNKYSFLCSLLILCFLIISFKIKKPLDDQVAKQTYINFTLDSNSYSFRKLTDPTCVAPFYCNNIQTVWSSTVGELNNSRIQINVALPEDPLLISTYDINKKNEITSNGHQKGSSCPLLFWINYRPDKNSEGYLTVANNNLNEQYVVYTKIEKGKPIPEERIKNTYYLTGYFQSYIKEDKTDKLKLMKGDFRIRAAIKSEIK